MSEMPTIRVGRVHRRVLITDFDVWLASRKKSGSGDEGAGIRENALEAAARRLGRLSPRASGSVVEAARKLMAQKKWDWEDR